jgi:hypothetical protein
MATRTRTPQPATVEPDPVIEAYKKDVDRTLLRQSLELSVEERLRRLQAALRFLEEWRGAAGKASR